MPRLASSPARSVTRNLSDESSRSMKKSRRKTTRPSAERVRRVLGCESSFVDSPSFRDPVVARRLSDYAKQVESASDELEYTFFSAKNPTLTVCAGGVTSLLKPEEERELFLTLNYLKRQANVLRATVDADRPKQSQIKQIETLHRQARVVRDRIISANLRLVMAIAKKQADARLTFDELFSEGVPVLMRAVEKFDIERGFRFSTYAYTAVRRSLYHAKMEANERSKRQRTSVETSVLERFGQEAPATDRLPDAAVPLVREMLECLPERESLVVRARFGLLQGQPACTLKEVGRLVGVSKERARQLLVRAYDRLRKLAEDTRFAAVLQVVGPPTDVEDVQA